MPFLLHFFNKERLSQLEKKALPQMDLLDYLKLMLVQIPHNQLQTVHLTVGLMELFKVITEYKGK